MYKYVKQYDFNPSKDVINFTKHKLHLSSSIPFLEADEEPDIEYERRNDEDRYRGTFRWNDHYLFISYTMRNNEETIRLISARPSTKAEIEHYYNRE